MNSSNLSIVSQQAMQRAYAGANNAIKNLTNTEPSKRDLVDVYISNANLGSAQQQTGSDALESTGAILSRLGELAVRGTDGTLIKAERQALQEEANQLLSELGTLSNTQHQGQSVLNGGNLSTNINGSLLLPQADSTTITTTLSGFDLSSQNGAHTGLSQVRNALSNLSLEKTIITNNIATLERHSSLAMQKSAHLNSAKERQEGDTLLDALHMVNASQTKLIIATKIHKTDQAMQKNTIDQLA